MVDEISEKLRDGCPSYYNESDYKYFLAVECLEKAYVSANAQERETLARDAFNHLTKIPESADLAALCKRFADLRLVPFVATCTPEISNAYFIQYISVVLTGKQSVYAAPSLSMYF